LHKFKTVSALQWYHNPSLIDAPIPKPAKPPTFKPVVQPDKTESTPGSKVKDTPKSLFKNYNRYLEEIHRKNHDEKMNKFIDHMQKLHEKHEKPRPKPSMTQSLITPAPAKKSKLSSSKKPAKSSISPSRVTKNYDITYSEVTPQHTATKTVRKVKYNPSSPDSEQAEGPYITVNVNGRSLSAVMMPHTPKQKHPMKPSSHNAARATSAKTSAKRSPVKK
jgi:hypothetical protein